MYCRNIFVTVGTTEFNDLIDIILSEIVLKELKQQFTCEKLTIQCGNSLNLKKYENFAEDNKYNIQITVYGLKPSIKDDLNNADLVISHAGAGSCIEVLNAHIPLIVVVNDKLMHNHQTELAEQLHQDGYVFCCTPETLLQTISLCDLKTLKHYPDGNVKKFTIFLDQLMGVETKSK